MSDYKRIGLVSTEMGSERPVVYIVQSLLKQVGHNISVDGDAGNRTVEAMKSEQAILGFKKPDGDWGKDTWTRFWDEHISSELYIDPKKLIHEMICYSETGSKNAYGFAEKDIGDGAGANYGVLQHNKLGSMNTLLKESDQKNLYTIYNSTNKYFVNEDIKRWMGSKEGREAQNTYFEKHIWNKAIQEINQIELKFDDHLLNLRLVGMFCDTQTQNGTMYSPSKPPYASPNSSIDAELYKGESWDYLFGKYISFKDLKDLWNTIFTEKSKEFKTYSSNKRTVERKTKRETNISVIKKAVTEIIPVNEAQLKLKFLAQYRARTSSYRWWKDVLSRRNVFANQRGKVHGTLIDLVADYCIDLVTEFDF